MVSPNDLHDLNGTRATKPAPLKFVLLCIFILPVTLLALAVIFYISFLITHRWDYLFEHPLYLKLSVVFVLMLILAFLAIKTYKQGGGAALFGNQAEQERFGILQQLNSIQDKEARKQAARKILSNKIIGQPWVGEKAQQTIRVDQQNGQWMLSAFLYLREYVKGAWRGKVQFRWLFLFGFLIVPKALSFIADTIPILAWPIAIFAVPYLVWWLVSAWRCAYNHSHGKWLGHLNRTGFIGLPVFGLVMAVFLYGLDIRQGVLVGLECKRDQATYENALAAKSEPKVVEQAKSALDACNIQKEVCFKDLDACRRKVIP